MFVWGTLSLKNLEKINIKIPSFSIESHTLKNKSRNWAKMRQKILMFYIEIERRDFQKSKKS